MYLPMLATEAEAAFDSPEYIFEPKWDGYRALYYTKLGEIRSRRGKSLTETFRHLTKTSIDEAVIDGELVSFASGRPDFASLRKNPQTAVLMAFDLLSVGGRDVTKLPLESRKEILKELIQGQHLIGFSPDYSDGIKLFAALKDAGWEGIVAKRKGSVYRPGERSSDWLKIVAYKEIDAVVLEVIKERGTALLGLFRGGHLEPVGHVPLRRYADLEQKGPQVVTVRYREYTGKAFRHARFVRTREDKSPWECTYEQLVQPHKPR